MRPALALAASVLLAACEPLPSGALPATTEGPGGGGASASAADLPCDVAALLGSRCGACHSDPPRYGAPMPLTSAAALHAPAASDSSRAVHEIVRERLHDEAHPMPPTGMLAEDELATLDAWLDAGAPAGTDTCGAGGGGAAGAPPVGPDALPCEPTHVFVAHGAGTDDAYHVPEAGAENEYECFTFASPFDGTTQATAWAPIVDDERVLHHWILYRTATPQVDGGVGPCAMPQDATFVAGWAPGGTNFVMPDDVGLELSGPADSFILQVHYHNAAHHPDAFDKSGVALCTTDVPRPHTAGVYTLGTVHIDVPPHAKDYQASGACGSFWTKYVPEPLHIVASFPHMHQLGRKLRTDIMRGADDGPIDTLVAVDPFSFDDQRYYAHDPPVVFQPGDGIRTTCTYDNPTNTAVHFGEKTEDEMCFNFVMLWPIDVFAPGNRSCGLF